MAGPWRAGWEQPVLSGGDEGSGAADSLEGAESTLGTWDLGSPCPEGVRTRPLSTAACVTVEVTSDPKLRSPGRGAGLRQGRAPDPRALSAPR